jgi:outer membrane immunogenic protein
MQRRFVGRAAFATAMVLAPTLAILPSFVPAIGAASAADIAPQPVLKAPPPPPPAFSWTGIYIGAHIGSGWATVNQTGTATLIGFPTFANPSPPQNLNGFLGGGQIGFNYQVSQWVWGLEAQFSGTGLDTTSACGNGVTAISFNMCHVKVDWMGTLAARLGWTVDHALIYVKGGAAVIHDKYDYQFLTGALTLIPLDNFSATNWGWMWGAGIEYALTNNWSAKIEYDYMQFGTKTYALPQLDALVRNQIAAPSSQEIKQQVHLIKFGVNYRFNWPTVVANY